MAVVRCSNGHYYDDEKFSRCPHCGIFANLDISQMKGGSRRKENDEKTVALSQTGRMPEDICRTIALEEALKNPGDDQKTVGYFSDSRGNDFGWSAWRDRSGDGISGSITASTRSGGTWE